MRLLYSEQKVNTYWLQIFNFESQNFNVLVNHSQGVLVIDSIFVINFNSKLQSSIL